MGSDRDRLDSSRPNDQQRREKAGVAAPTVTGFELLGADPKMSTLQKLTRAPEAAGAQFIDEYEHGGPGVRLRNRRSACTKSFLPSTVAARSMGRGLVIERCTGTRSGRRRGRKLKPSERWLALLNGYLDNAIAEVGYEEFSDA
jgi:hypothetical protein